MVTLYPSIATKQLITEHDLNDEFKYVQQKQKENLTSQVHSSYINIICGRKQPTDLSIFKQPRFQHPQFAGSSPTASQLT